MAYNNKRRVEKYDNGVFGKNRRVTKVFYDTKWEEYQVRLYVGNVLERESDYYTDDLEDAKGTAQTML